MTVPALLSVQYTVVLSVAMSAGVCPVASVAGAPPLREIFTAAAWLVDTAPIDGHGG
jgi:hypothetical protein